MCTSRYSDHHLEPLQSVHGEC